MQGLTLYTASPIRRPKHVDKLYIHTDYGAYRVGIYTEQRLPDHSTLRLFTFDRDTKRTYVHRSRRRTSGVRW